MMQLHAGVTSSPHHWRRTARRMVLVAALAAASSLGSANSLVGRDAVHTPLERESAEQPSEPDTDGDTMPDAWETFFGLNPNDPADAATDLDADGLTNLQEYATQGHPRGTHQRYFAEGATGFFDTSFGLVNLSSTETAHVLVTYLTDVGETFSSQVTLEPLHRETVSANTALGELSRALSTIVESDAPIGADRLMRWGANWIGSSLGEGVESPAATWYLAEGATGVLSLYYLIQNPGFTPATVTVRYLRDVGAPITKVYAVPARSRRTIWVNQEDAGLAAVSLGAVVTATVPVVVERAMYLDGSQVFEAGSVGAGLPSLATTWHFAEGATGPFFDEFLTLLNPSPTSSATATITFHLQDGTTLIKSYDVDSEHRRTVWLNSEGETDPAMAALANGSVWVSVVSDLPIVVERAMWWPHNQPWYGGHSAPGTSDPQTAWVIPEGGVGGPASESTYVLIANPSASAVTVELTLVNDAGTTTTQTVGIGAETRLTLDLAATFGLTAGQFSLFVQSLGAPAVPIVVDYSRYSSGDGRIWTTGSTSRAVPGVVGGAETAPSVVSTVPANGANNASVNANLQVTFSEPVTVTAAAFTLVCPVGVAIPFTNLTASPTTTFTLDPTGPLPIDTTCTLTINASQVTDADTNDPPDTMAASHSVTFGTEGENAPSVVTTSPANGATQVSVAANLTITFDEPVGVMGNWFEIACAATGTRHVTDATVSGTQTSVVIDPNTNFAPGEICAVMIFAAQVSDQDPIDPPDNMATNHTFSFTADMGPTITATTPASGATDSATNTDVTVTFSEAMNVAANWFQIVCTVSGTRDTTNALVSGGPTSFAINPIVDFAPGESCTVTITAAQVTDSDAGDPPDTLAADYAFSFSTDVGPSVVATLPVNGAVGLPTTTAITVTFSENVTLGSNWFQTPHPESPAPRR